MYTHAHKPTHAYTHTHTKHEPRREGERARKRERNRDLSSTYIIIDVFRYVDVYANTPTCARFHSLSLSHVHAQAVMQKRRKLKGLLQSRRDLFEIKSFPSDIGIHGSFRKHTALFKVHVCAGVFDIETVPATCNFCSPRYTFMSVK